MEKSLFVALGLMSCAAIAGAPVEPKNAGFHETDGKDNAVYGPFAGIALETQFCPDAIHHPTFEQPICTPDHPFTRRTVLKFGLA